MKYIYPVPEDVVSAALSVKEIIESKLPVNSLENRQLLFSCIDLTSLNTTDTFDEIKSMVDKVNKFHQNYPNVPNVAAICVFPATTHVVSENAQINGLGIATVSGGFPASQTTLAVKLFEAKEAVKAGATELDIVIPVGRFLAGDYNTVFNEIHEIKKAIGNIHLKVILETGALKTTEAIWKASNIAMEAGADFIKTSTGKMQPAATLEAMYVMTRAIADFYKATGKKVGIKPAGGISDTETAIKYFAMITNNLGHDWCNNKLFRIGASSLANKLLGNIVNDKSVKYF